MSSLGRVLGVCGLVALLSVPLTLFVWDWQFSWVAWAKIAFGLIAILFYLVTNRRGVRETFQGRSVFYGLLNALLIGLMLFAVAVTNYIVQAHPGFVDLTSDRIHSLAVQTLEVLDRLEEPVEVQAFYGGREPEYEMVRDYLDRFRAHNELFRFELFDPIERLDMVEKHKIKMSGPRILLRYRDREERIRTADPSASGLEESLTAALLRLTGPGEADAICFTTGHGEKALSGPDRQRTLELFARDLQAEGYRTDAIALLDLPEVPESCKAVVVAGPERDLSPEEIDSLAGFLENGGRMMVLAGAADSSSLTSLLASSGIVLGRDTVIQAGGRSPLYAVSDPARYPRQHPIFSRFLQRKRVPARQLQAVFPMARSVRAAEGARPATAELAATHERAWAERDPLGEDGRVAFDPERDSKGPIPLAVVTSLGDGDEAGRLAVFGSSLFAVDQAYGLYPFNRDLTMNTMAWLLEQEKSITIRPRLRAASLLRLDESELKFITFFSSDILPLLILAFGISIWQIRKWS